MPKIKKSIMTTPKYRKTVIISLSDVMNGPDAVEGSILIFLKMIGTIQPMNEAILIPKIRVVPMIPLIKNGLTAISLPNLLTIETLSNLKM